MAFKDYLTMRWVHDDPQGDFIKDALSDPKLPDFATWPDLRRYLLRAGRSHAIEAAQLVWAAYRAKLWRDKRRMAA
ncbi:MAG: hypothetical protein ACOY5U_09845 [Pseudomonadota bacterium]